MTVAELIDDPFRSLAGELRRAGGFAKDTTPFSEFLWADFLRRRVKRETVEADFKHALEKALELAKARRRVTCPAGVVPSSRNEGKHSCAKIRTRVKAPRSPCSAFQLGQFGMAPLDRHSLRAAPDRQLVELDNQRARCPGVTRTSRAEPVRELTDSASVEGKIMAQAEAGGALSHLNHEIVASLDDFQIRAKSGAASSRSCSERSSSSSWPPVAA